MKRNESLRAMLALLAVAGLVGLNRLNSAPPVQGPLVVVDGGGKEHKLKTWKFIAGTRPLAWLAPAAPPEDPTAKDAPPKPTGPEALAFREEHSTNFVDGIVTLVPLDRVRSLKYDSEGQTVTLTAASGAKDADSVELTGSTRFKGINKLTIEAEADLGDLGLADVKFQGGIPTGGIRSLTFPAPKAPAAAPAGRGATIIPEDKKDREPHKVSDLQPLYRLADGRMKLLPTLMFRKTVKLDVTKIQKLHQVEGTPADAPEFQLTLKDGAEHTLTLLKTIDLDDQKMTLEGLVGKVPAGFKLFPIHTIADVQFDEEK
jgi:hypothetical protein